MPAELFVFKLEDAPKRNLEQLKVALGEKLEKKCQIEEHELGPWITIEDYESDMVFTIDEDGKASSATLQCLDDPDAVERIVAALIAIGWQVEEM